MGIKWQNNRSPYIVGMLHDICKTDDYVEEDTIDGNFTWKYNTNKILKGHGDKSVILLSQFINLTEEELLCIRFHMGAYETEDWDAYDKAIRKYETVLWTHHADMYASKVLNT
jgi:HD superfamily phosphohydrolase YqeK